MAVSARRKPRLVETPPIRLRVGLGSEEGFTNIAMLPEVRPCLFREINTVDSIYSSFHFHRLDKAQRWEFMNEAYRILKPGSQLLLVMPHAWSSRAIADPLAQWPPLCESSFMVYSRAWREQEGFTDLPLTCDFGASYGYGHTCHPEIPLRNDEWVAHAKEHELNWILDLHVTLTKEP